MGVTKLVPALGARGGRQGLCVGRAVLAQSVASSFCSGP